MIRAVVFDFDGTLIQTERLKAKSYARAAVQLKPDAFSEEEVFTAFEDFVGGSREEVSKGLVARFDLEDAARPRMAEYSASVPWQVLTRLRLQIYNEMLSDDKTIREAGWKHNIDLIQQVRAANCKVGLATMSYCQRVKHLLQALGLETAFDFIATREDVDNPKPDPEIYLLVARELNIATKEMLIVEDSLAGVRAGLAAGASVLAVATPMTKKQLHQSNLLDEQNIVDGPETLVDKLNQLLKKAE